MTDLCAVLGWCLRKHRNDRRALETKQGRKGAGKSPKVVIVAGVECDSYG